AVRRRALQHGGVFGLPAGGRGVRHGPRRARLRVGGAGRRLCGLAAAAGDRRRMRAMSDYTLTANFSLYKPTPGADDDVWGDHLNLNADTLDELIQRYLPLSGGGMVGPLTLAGDAAASLQAVTLQQLNGAISGAPFLPLTGGTMVGPLILSGDPATALGASTRQYVDAQIASTNGTTAASYVPLSQKAAALGVATLDATGKLPTAQMPAAATGTLSYKGGWNAATNTPTMASGALAGGVLQPIGNYYVVTVSGTTAAIDGVTSWVA